MIKVSTQVAFWLPFRFLPILKKLVNYLNYKSPSSSLAQDTGLSRRWTKGEKRQSEGFSFINNICLRKLKHFEK